MLRLKKSAAILIVLLIIISVSACGSSGELKKEYAAYSPQQSQSAVVASNDHFQLLWDDTNKCILLMDNRNGEIWSSVPYDYYKKSDQSGTALVQLYSPLLIEYYETESFQVKKVNAYSECISNGTVNAKRLKNGLSVTYFFERLKISVPVDYILTDDGLEARLRVDKIAEKKNLVTKISLLPYFASAAATDGSYLVIPSGSGALMYTDCGKRNVREYTGAVYGEDLNRNENEKISNYEQIRLPFFGVRDQNRALCAILGKGSESAYINAQAGNAEIGYSSVYATFEIRGYDYVSTQNMHGVTSIVLQYPNQRLKADYVSVEYIPISGDNAGYVDMAKLYRSRLKNRKTLSDEPGIYLKILGAALEKRLILGVPSNVIKPLTTVNQAAEVINKIKASSDEALAVQLIGFGKYGMSTGKIGGGFEITAKLGSKKDVAELKTIKSAQFFIDYDVINFSKSGNGVSFFYDCARTPNNLALNKLEYSVENYNKSTGSIYRLLKRASLEKVSNQAVESAEKYGFDGISFASLSSCAYSDYSSPEYISKGLISEQTTGIIERVKQNKMLFAADKANAYAAEAADYVFEAPTETGSDDALDEIIPLYQMVYKSYVPFSCESINLSSDPERTFLNTVSTGGGLCFTVCNDNCGVQRDIYNNAPAFSQFDKIYDSLKTYAQRAKLAHKATEGAGIDNYLIANDGIRITEFSNGVKIIVNYSENEYIFDGTQIPAKDFVLSGVK